MSAAWNLCSNLQVLHIIDLRVEKIRAIVGTPKYLLKEIRVYRLIYRYGELNSIESTIMNIMAEGTCRGCG